MRVSRFSMVRRRFQKLLISALLLACSNGTPRALPDDRVWESEHFRYHSRGNDAEVCEGVLDQLERHFALLQNYLQFPWKAGTKVEYFKFRDLTDFKENSPCSDAPGGCTTDGRVMSADVLSHHELIHGYLNSLGIPPAFLGEGIAVALACGYSRQINPQPWRDVITLPYGNERNYVEGPWFVAYLLQQYGPAPFLSWYRAVGYRASSAEIAAAFRDSYQLPLDDAWSAALASGRTVRCNYLWECSGPALATDGSAESVAMACDGSDIFRTFRTDDARDAVLSTTSGLVYSPVSCDDPVPTAVGFDDDVAWETTIAPFATGKYFVASYDVGSEIALSVLPDRALGNGCEDLTALDLGSSQFTKSSFALALPNDGQTWFAKLGLGGTSACLGKTFDDFKIEQCPSCDGTPACEDVTCPFRADGAGDVTLRITPLAPASDGFTGFDLVFWD